MRNLLFFSLFMLVFQPLHAERGLHLKKMKNEQRVALVIGNNNYIKMSMLKNPINDARSMRQALKSRGFEVIYKENATKRDMKKLVKKFSKKLSRGGVGMYFFAGHGVNVEGRNYLVAVDSVMDEADDVEYEALALDYVTSKIKNSGNRLNIIALDACRNNPFSRSGGGGLAPIGNAKGLFVAYATEAGDVASDNKKEKNGLFTKHLLSSMNQPGANLASVFKKARQGVYDESNGKQSPGVYDQTLGEFYFTLPDKNTKTSFSLNELQNSMVTIPAGSFLMGSKNGDDDVSEPIHLVKLKSFKLGQYEVTQKEWYAIMGNNPSKFFGCDTCPVEGVSWDDIQDFLRKLNKQTVQHYRLPTEAEWEYACRSGGKNQEYCGGRNYNTVGWHGDNSFNKTQIVGRKEPNALGLYDMSGNVREWTQDCWNESYNGSPSNGKAWLKGDCSGRVLRGGSYTDHYLDTTSWYRTGHREYARINYFGFRLAQDLH